jgi:hypothetical protein
VIDMGSIAAVFSSLNTAKEIAKGMVNLHTATEIQAATIDLNGKIIDAQQQLFSVNQAQTAQAERIRELEGQIAAMKDWDAQKQRYKLAAPSSGGMVYALQKSMSDGEPPHYLCAACFKKGQPSILQGKEGRNTKAEGWLGGCYQCPTCKSEAMTGYNDVPAPQYYEDIAART